MRAACWITKATHTRLVHIILLAFQWQYWCRERAAVLHYKNIVCLVLNYLRLNIILNLR
jgi:hypothetical protein